MRGILLIDDDRTVCRLLSELLEGRGHRALSRHTLGEGLAEASSGEWDVVLLDVHLPDGNGLEAVSRIRETPGEPQVIILTGYGDQNGAEAAIRDGVWDYVPKTGRAADVMVPVERALQYRAGRKGAGGGAFALDLEGVVGRSPAMKECLDLVAASANTDSNVLLTGETGTGKEVLARAIHRNSARSGGPFVVVDCASLPESILESTLFGHEKGAFTGAHRSREGLVALSHGGSLLLDEVGELPPTSKRAF